MINKRPASNKHRTFKFSANLNSYDILPVAQPICIWNSMYIWFIDRENKVSTFNIVHFPNYEISASL